MSSSSTEAPVPPIATTTAGLRGAHWKAERMPEGVSTSVHSLTTDDGVKVTGYLFRRGGERTVICGMHPREMLVTQYIVPEVLRAGCAMWVMAGRAAGNDMRLEHESAVMDLGAGQRFLEGCGYKTRVLLGISGGGPLAAYYIQQAGCAPEERMKMSPAGRPTKLGSAKLPSPDGLVLVSSHLGQGHLMLNSIDPSVVDELDAFSIDESLSAFSERNGFRRPPQSSSYSPDFVAAYRAAQRLRMERIDVYAKAVVARRAEARSRLKAKPTRKDAIEAAHTPIFNVWRTDADLRCYDLRLDPSDRAYGSIWGANPIVSNYGSAGFARVCTAESWLSNWSCFSSNATMEKCARSITQPTLVIEFTGDNGVFPEDAARLFSMIGTSDKERVRIHGNHHGEPIIAGVADGQLESGRILNEWLRKRSWN